MPIKKSFFEQNNQTNHYLEQLRFNLNVILYIGVILLNTLTVYNTIVYKNVVTVLDYFFMA